MLHGEVVAAVDKRIVCSNVFKAANAWERARGLLARKPLSENQGLWLEPCPSVHTIGMRYSIDIVFLNSDGYVKKIVPALKPLRFAACSGATATLELAEGQATKLDIHPGMQLNWKQKDT